MVDRPDLAANDDANADEARGRMQAFRRGVARSVASLASLLAIYYALPVGELPRQTATVALSVVGVLAGVAVLTWLAAANIRRQLRASDAQQVRMERLLGIIYVAIVLFAIAYYALATSADGQIADLETKTDALYFTMSTLATVGFGDVHASGQIARAIVTVQIVFNIVVIGTLVSVFTGRLRLRAQASRGGGVHP